MATISGTVSGLDGVAFSVAVDWGDGQTSDSDNGGQPFYFAAGTTSFTVNHYYSDPGDYTIVATVTPTDTTDNRAVTGSVGLSVNAVAPRVVLAVPPEPDGGYDPDTAYEFAATGYSPDGGTMDYLWTVYDPTNGSVTATYTGPTAQLTEAQAGCASVTVTDAGTGLATCVYSLTDLNNDNLSGLVWSTNPSALPTVTITETDTNQTVTAGAGSVATFDVQLQWAGGTQYWFPSVFYNTIDSSGAAPAGYVSTYGPQAVNFGDVVYNALTGMNTADGTVTVAVPRASAASGA